MASTAVAHVRVICTAISMDPAALVPITILHMDKIP